MPTTAAAGAACGRTVRVCGFKPGAVIGAQMCGHLGTSEGGPELNQIMATGRSVERVTEEAEQPNNNRGGGRGVTVGHAPFVLFTNQRC